MGSNWKMESNQHIGRNWGSNWNIVGRNRGSN